jgi:hypothetical protein
MEWSPDSHALSWVGMVIRSTRCSKMSALLTSTHALTRSSIHTEFLYFCVAVSDQIFTLLQRRTVFIPGNVTVKSLRDTEALTDTRITGTVL